MMCGFLGLISNDEINIDKLEEFQLGEVHENDLALAVQMSLQRESNPKTAILSPRKKRCRGKNKDNSR